MYSVAFGGVTWTAAQTDVDFFAWVGVADVALRLHYIEIGQSSDPGDAQAEMLRWDINTHTTVGSGGATVTPVAMEPGLPTADGTFRRMDTTRGSVSVTTVWEGTWNAQAGLIWVPPPKAVIQTNGTTRLAIGSPSTVADDLIISGTIVVEQIG
jgi:hypothetical protein